MVRRLAEPQQMRSAFGEALLRQVEALEAPERDAIVGRLAEETREHYRRAKAIGWSPMTLHMNVSDCIRAVVGSARNIDLWADTMADLTRRPMLSGFLRHIGARLGVGPGTLYRQNARLWRYLCRNVGHLSAEVGSNETTVELVEFPAADHQFPCFVEGLDGCLQGLVAGLDVRPRVEVVALDLDAGNVRYHITW